MGRELNIKHLGIMGQKLFVSIQDLFLYMPYLQSLLSESVKLMFSQYESGMMLQEYFKYIRSNYFIVLFLLVI